MTAGSFEFKTSFEILLNWSRLESSCRDLKPTKDWKLRWIEGLKEHLPLVGSFLGVVCCLVGSKPFSLTRVRSKLVLAIN